MPALLWGVAFGNILRGIPLNAAEHFTGNFWTFLNPYALLGGVTTLTLFTLHGALFLALKTTGELRARAIAAAVGGRRSPRSSPARASSPGPELSYRASRRPRATGIASVVLRGPGGRRADRRRSWPAGAGREGTAFAANAVAILAAVASPVHRALPARAALHPVARLLADHRERRLRRARPWRS